MAFCIIMGENEFKSKLKGYENVRAQCANCGNWNTQCVTRWPWFTVCWIPVLPLATHKYKDLACHTCNFHQDLKYRPEIQPGQDGQGHAMQGYGAQGANQGWGPGSGPGPGPGPGPGQGGQPQYK